MYDRLNNRFFCDRIDQHHKDAYEAQFVDFRCFVNRYSFLLDQLLPSALIKCYLA